MINILETANKLRQFGLTVRLKGTDADKRRILDKNCSDQGIAPVIDVDGHPAF